MTSSQTASIQLWASQLSHADAATRRAAAEALMKVGREAAIAAVELVRAVGNDDETVQTRVAETLENLGAPPAAALGGLIPFLSDANSDRGYWAATLLGRLESTGAPAASALGACLSTTERASNVRERAAWALGQLGPAAVAARPALEAASHDPSPRLARLAQEALKRL